MTMTPMARTVDMENCKGSVRHASMSEQMTSAMPVGGNPMETFGYLGNIDADNAQFTEDENEESTEYSSSFGASCSISDDEIESGMSNFEVDSHFQGRINADVPTSAPKMARHKQVAAEWRKAIGPLMWRCHWLELRMKDLLSQVEKYDEELAKINHEKNLQLEIIKADSSEPELVKLDFQSHDSNIMKRIKRKRHEDTVDTMMYMKCHRILSHFYGNTETDGLLVYDGFNSLVVEDVKNNLGSDNASFESKENDRVLEQYSLREIILAIDGAQSRILRLQKHLSMVHGIYEKLTSYVDHARVKVPRKSKTVQNHLTSHKKDRSSLQKMKDGSFVHKMKDLSSLLQEEDICPFQMVPYSDVGYTESADDVLIDNRAAQEEGYQQFEKVKQVAEKHSELVNKVVETFPFKGERVNSQMARDDLVEESAPIVKHACSGIKRQQDPKKKHGSSVPASSDQIEKSPDTSTKKKTEKEPPSLKNEKHILLDMNTRRSQRVRKPKIY